MLLQALATAAALAQAPAGIRSVTLIPQDGRLTTQMRARVDTAHALHLRPIVLVTSPSCGQECEFLDRALKTPDLIRVFRAIYVIKIDPDTWGGQFIQYGFAKPSLPIFDTIDDAGYPADQQFNGWSPDSSNAANARLFDRFFASLPAVGSMPTTHDTTAADEPAPTVFRRP
jgi:hypothetical protein